jgi:hypothetical protein
MKLLIGLTSILLFSCGNDHTFSKRNHDVLCTKYEERVEVRCVKRNLFMNEAQAFYSVMDDAFKPMSMSHQMGEQHRRSSCTNKEFKVSDCVQWIVKRK